MLISRLFTLSVILVISNAEHILLLSTLSSKSHSIWYEKLTKLLAGNGHKIVELDTMKRDYKHPNITHITMSGAYTWLNEFEEQVRSSPQGLEAAAGEISIWENLMLVTDPNLIGCRDIFMSEETKKFVEDYRDVKFDMIIADGYCEPFFGMASLFGSPPLVLATPYIEINAADFAGMLHNPSYVPFHLSNYSPDMNFFERMANAIYSLINQYAIKYYAIPNSDKLIKQVLGPSASNLRDIYRNNVALVLTGYNQVLQGAKPMPPNYIPIPFFHIEPPKPLPKDIKKFLDEAKDGAILFSMGSNFQSILMSEEKREMFLSVFKKIPQRVIWKLELNDSSSIPPNVMIKKWLPQSDILSHPNIKLFISHGGIHGTQEAMYHGVPIIGLPLIFDQVANLLRIERSGIGIKMQYEQLTAEGISRHINTILTDPSYAQNMKQVSSAVKDVPQPPRERALFWIEYVLRNGSKYIRPKSVDLQWYQIIYLDAIGFILLCAIVAYMTVKSIIKCLINIVCGLTKKTNNKKKKQ